MDAWAAFVAECRRRYPNPWDAPFDGAVPTDEVYVEARLRSPDRPLLFLTRRAFAARLEELEEEVRDADRWSRAMVPTDAYLRALALVLGEYDDIRFIGDLDPCDLAAFRALETGSELLAPRRGWRFPVVHAGVNSAWMELAERFIGPKLMQCTIPMNRMERRELAALRASWRAMEAVIGSRAMDLLDGGRKLEVEGATVWTLDNPEYRRELLHLVFGGDRDRQAALRAITAGAELAAVESAKRLAPNAKEASVLMRVLDDAGKPAHNRVAAAYALRYAKPRVDPRLFAKVVANSRAPAELRGMAAESLGNVLMAEDRRRAPYRVAVEDLICSLSDPSTEVRFWCAFALGAARANAALPELRRLARSDRSRVKGWGTVGKEARDAIAHIETGKWPLP